MAIPTPGTSSKLEDVSPSWAVGSTSDPFFKTFILRRIGSSWAQITSPSPSGSLNELYGVVQLGPDNAWAVGDLEGPSAQRTLILHWNGTTWKRIASPNAGDASTPNILLDVDAVSAHDIWAVGTSGNSFPNKTLTLHWNGSKWKRVPSPNFDAATFGDSLIDVAAVASDNVWAVGNTSVGSASEALVLHWNGSKWKRSSLPAGDHSILQGATAFGAKNVWAVGETGLGNLVLHWNGRAWKKISVANPGTLENGLNAIGGSSPGNFWAVGQSRDEGPTPYQARAMHCC